MTQSPSFAVIPGTAVQAALAGREAEVMDLIESAYRLHGSGRTVNPPSYFLRFPDRPEARIIALPAAVGGEVDTAGLKWISSFPANVAEGLPRASAVLLLNDRTTGYPFACLESSIISATRTAASAALAALVLGRGREQRGRIGLVGTGLIARYIHRYLAATGHPMERIGLYDHSPDRVRGFGDYLRGVCDTPVEHFDDLEGLIRTSDVIVFATTAGTPHVTDPGWFDHAPLVLNISLRDVSADVVLSSVNVVDDVEHCLKANTSVHLTEQATGNRDFLHATLYDVLAGDYTVPTGRTVLFSPFGLGVLDIVLGEFVYRTGDRQVVDGFFSDLETYGVTR
ncbi:2,3-diaminopropionate biosynthesis protein SbnB [Actinoplanes sp. TBRC 11911]|uniref:2,3-diaminopropionate biosynthesis protein SbnB n=1 Tax=Actinoplanes sp. TBRC 11911 TaxID=2729386 RepID=UPI00145E1908|nr:2,3-diaminopropionate biosynthesis protein SbnB [Actinoplanes sp. TBRC 11911]NMO53363.1 2,3-diaminopropionate biosynthesis protein SbnB [Actinoplanes sp. TBRC 11911]